MARNCETSGPKDIRNRRRELGISFDRLARLAGVSPTELRRCERGLVFPDESFFAAVGAVLGAPVPQLLVEHERLMHLATPGEGYTTASGGGSFVRKRRAGATEGRAAVVDLFCGIGGFSNGFEQTGTFQVTVGIDLLADRINTFAENHPAATVICGDIRDTSLTALAANGPAPDVIIGGPPCQGFSSIRPFRTLTEKDQRNNLFEYFVLAVDWFRPTWFVLENVVGLLTHRDGQTLMAITDLFRQVGYTAEWKVLNAALYGLPQRRERLIIVGNRNGLTFRWPEPTHYFNGRSMAGRKYGQFAGIGPLFTNNLRPAVSVMQAIHDLPEVGAGASANTYRDDVEPTEYERHLRGEENVLTWHEATAHSDRMLEIIRLAGHNRSALPLGLTSSGFSSCYSRLEADLPSVTVTVNFVHPASNKCIHPSQDRALTPREGARLQGFPDSFKFPGTRAQTVKQIGNAVPPFLGRVIAAALEGQL